MAASSPTCAKSPNKAPHFQLAYADAAELQKPDDHLRYVDWTLALTHLEDANRIKPSAHNCALIGIIRSKTQQYDEGPAALAEAEKKIWHQPINAGFCPGRILWKQFVLSTGDCDVLLNPGFTAPWSARCPQLTWIHDLQHKRHPEYFKPADLLAWRFLVWAAARRSKAILTLNEKSR